MRRKSGERWKVLEQRGGYAGCTTTRIKDIVKTKVTHITPTPGLGVYVGYTTNRIKD